MYIFYEGPRILLLMNQQFFFNYKNLSWYFPSKDLNKNVQKSWTSDLRKFNIRPTKVEHPTYRKSTYGNSSLAYKAQIFP